MPQALVSKPIVLHGYELKCYRCGHEFISIAKTLKIGYVHCNACNATNYVRMEDINPKE